MRGAARWSVALVAAAALPGCGDKTAAEDADVSSRTPRVVVRVLNDGVAAGSFVDVVVRLENVGPAGTVKVTFGDNGAVGGWASADTGCGVQPGRSDEHRLRHAYRKGGAWTVSATFQPEACNGVPATPYAGSAVAHVADAPAPSNGPSPPRIVNVGQSKQPTARGEIAFQAQPEDEDGYLTELRYSWGDGSPDSVFRFPLSDCVDPSDHWPMTAVTESSDPSWVYPRHRYPRPGGYDVTVTATTAGCDGRSPQVARAKGHVTAP